MREYLTWEINLVNDIAKDNDHRFRITNELNLYPALLTLESSYSITAHSGN